MASDAVSTSPQWFARGDARSMSFQQAAVAVLTPLASLRITVTMFALSIILILVGTLAQVNMSMWEVMDRYFLAWLTWIDFQVFFPRSWFPNWQQVPGGFPFPGGAAIGAVLVMNLAAAALVRFKVQARGRRLAWGVGVMFAAFLVTALVIYSGHNRSGLQGQPPLEWETIWLLVKCGLAAVSLAAVVGSWQLGDEMRIERILLATAGVLLGLLTVWLFLAGQSAYLGDSGMRILWQLIKGLFAGLLLLVGGWLLYKKRGGVIVIHIGVALLMFGQYWVAKYDVEEQIALAEGESTTYARDIRRTELAIVKQKSAREDEVVVIPQSLLQASESGGSQYSWSALWGGGSTVDEEGVIAHALLPFDVQVIKYFKNAKLRDVKPDEENRATLGTGLRMVAEPVKAGSGADSDSRVDLAAAYVRLTAEDGEELGVVLLSQIASSQDVSEKVQVGGDEYELSLRFKRNYKPYQVTLLDVRKDDYLGTNTPRNYSSEIRLQDEQTGTDRTIPIWMNNPLRYSGETFYQTGYSGPPDFPNESTTLSVVTNSGWMIPYVACMIVWSGLTFHFLLSLLRFLRRQAAQAAQAAIYAAEVVGESDERKRPRNLGLLVGAVLGVVGLAGLLLPALALLLRVPLSSGMGLALLALMLLAAGLALVGASYRDPSRYSSPARVARLAAWPLLVMGLFAMLLWSRAHATESVVDDFQLHAFGRLPVVADGRVKPFDTLARNTLKVISNRETFRARQETDVLRKEWSGISRKLVQRYDGIQLGDLREGYNDVPAVIDRIAEKSDADRYRVEEYVDKLTTRTYPAVRWLLDVITEHPRAERYKVFRIENLEVLATLGLERRKGFLYSLDEIRPRVLEFEKQVDQARRLDVSTLSTFQRKLLETDRRIRTFTRLGAAFQQPRFPELPTQEEFENERQVAVEKLERFRRAYFGFIQQIESIRPPLAVPTKDEEGQETWESYAKAWATAFIDVRVMGKEPAPALNHLNRIFVAYQNDEASTFNSEVGRYANFLARETPDELKGKSTAVGEYVERRFGTFYAFEEHFNRVSPFFFCWWPYIAAFVLTAIAWMVGRRGGRTLNWTAFALIVFTLGIHTMALAARIQISGRPPVTNLYSSAVFIGWAAVLFGLGFELVYRNGIGNAVAALLGFMTLVIAHNLAGDGDTFAVLQAVLDTQFWLATHVVTVTLGYAATFVAGAFGIAFIVARLLLPLAPETRADLTRIIYGSVCFALLFSFVGTVLGGLWADDSWGRFWGWDPKENGALIIVIWNALMLHARWGGMVRDRGLAVLAIGGNIVTAWSWFGVNELGVGLHSYGFTEGVLLALGLFWLSQLAFIGIGLLPFQSLLFRQHATAAKPAEGK